MPQFSGEGTSESERFWRAYNSSSSDVDHWQEFRESFKSSLDTLDLNHFKSWYNIRGLPLWGGLWSNESEEVQHINKISDFLSNNKEQRWKDSLKEELDFYSHPSHSPSYSIAGIDSEITRVRYLYHWITLFENGIDAKDLNFIFEFGGGVGHIPKLTKQLGFSGEYFIYDFPELCSIQNFYNKMQIKTASDLALVDTLLSPLKESRGGLFYSTWGFSESPLKTRLLMQKHFKHFDYFAILYQSNIFNLNNKDFFKDMAWIFSDIDWVTVDHPSTWDGGSKYLIGKRRYPQP